MDISQILNRARAMLVEEDAGTVLAGVEGTVSVQLKSGVSSQVEVLVLSARPLNFDFILGMNALLIFKGVTVRTPNDVKFGVDEVVQCGMVERPLNPLDIKFITSAENKADVLTRVPKKWLSSGSQLVCGVVASVPKNEISKIHITSGNPGIKPNKIFNYEVRLLGIDSVSKNEQPVDLSFEVGDRVWVRHPSRRCDIRSHVGTVTKITSAQNIEVDGTPRHVRDL
ncbi:hypothetical protein Pcinc_027036 [Petrolisthes cinctipes]|uniref:Uncharacterized protein n=1 Tax=Petrolisthes cinctipes TaxID=88211 RepID=A0AAE1F551_PETCI|nr:hypothetical protein Pcinc_027036 [Petrolisthes cinctipes]